MTTVKILLRAEEPLALTDGSAESMGHQTLFHIPGNMLLGAFASCWKKAHRGLVPDDDAEFRALFLDDQVEWGHAYPCLGQTACVPIPLPYQRDKLHGGLPCEGGSADDCKVFNLLAIKKEEAGELLKDVKLKKLGQGFMSPVSLCQPDMKTGWAMHVDISAKRTASDGKLFGYSSIAPGPLFASLIYCKTEETANALQALVAKSGKIRVGHARSAGYGGMSCSSVLASPADIPANRFEGNSATLFFLSDYLPHHSWLQPLASLRQELESALGVAIDIDHTKQFCSYGEIAAFNSFWSLPRRSASAILRGSVIRISWQGNARPLPHSLGGRRREGYGRFLVDPDFLKEARVRPQVEKALNAPAAPVTAQGPILALIRRRGLERLANEAAIAFVDHDKVSAFLQSVAKNDKPGPSQLGNIRNLVSTHDDSRKWQEAFSQMLKKTPGRQWTGSEAYSPFSNFHDTLDVIMPQFLDATACLDLLGDTCTARLPGGPATASERSAFARRFHRLAMLELLSAWDKAMRGILKKREKK